VSVQVAICVVLLAACLLSLQGLRQALTMPIGFQPRGVALVAFDLSRAGYTLARGRAFQQEVLAAVRQLPGVERAAYSSELPLMLDSSTNTVFSEEEAARSGRGRDVEHYSVSPGFFETMALQVVRGRDFTWQDTTETPRVAIVNEAFARQILRANDPIGRRFRYLRTGRLIEVIGVVRDTKIRTLTESPQPAVFDPTAQVPNLTTFLVARSSLPTPAVASALRKTIADLDPALSLYSVGSVEDAMGFALVPNQAAAVALTAFGVIAMILAVTGIHGAVAYAVSRRRREIGIRVAIGATRRDILMLVFGRILRLLMSGAAVGLVLALVIGPLLTQVVYLASPREPWMLVGVCGLTLILGVAACWGPARTSLRVEPLSALRAE
jgi:predicted permease